ncbi:MAG: hypothetical protein WD055_03285 [Candidatus Dependentiae bacterium]
MNKNILAALLCVVSLGFLASCGKDCCPEECDPCETTYTYEDECNECSPYSEVDVETEQTLSYSRDITSVNKF